MKIRKAILFKITFFLVITAIAICIGIITGSRDGFLWGLAYGALSWGVIYQLTQNMGELGKY